MTSSERVIREITVAAALGAGLQAGRVQTGVGFGHREAAFFAAGDQRREHARLLFVGAEDDDGVEAEDVHVNGGGAGHAGAGLGDGLHHDAGLGDAEAGAAIFRRDANAEETFGGQRLVQVVREGAVGVAGQPIGIVEPLAQPGDGVADGLLFGSQCEVHLSLRRSRGMARYPADKQGGPPCPIPTHP